MASQNSEGKRLLAQVLAHTHSHNRAMDRLEAEKLEVERVRSGYTYDEDPRLRTDDIFQHNASQSCISEPSQARTEARAHPPISKHKTLDRLDQRESSSSRLTANEHSKLKLGRESEQERSSRYSHSRLADYRSAAPNQPSAEPVSPYARRGAMERPHWREWRECDRGSSGSSRHSSLSFGAVYQVGRESESERGGRRDRRVSSDEENSSGGRKGKSSGSKRLLPPPPRPEPSRDRDNRRDSAIKSTDPSFGIPTSYREKRNDGLVIPQPPRLRADMRGRSPVIAVVACSEDAVSEFESENFPHEGKRVTTRAGSTRGQDAGRSSVTVIDPRDSNGLPPRKPPLSGGKKRRRVSLMLSPKFNRNSSEESSPREPKEVEMASPRFKRDGEARPSTISEQKRRRRKSSSPEDLSLSPRRYLGSSRSSSCSRLTPRGSGGKPARYQIPDLRPFREGPSAFHSSFDRNSARFDESPHRYTHASSELRTIGSNKTLRRMETVREHPAVKKRSDADKGDTRDDHVSGSHKKKLQKAKSAQIDWEAERLASQRRKLVNQLERIKDPLSDTSMWGHDNYYTSLRTAA